MTCSTCGALMGTLDSTCGSCGSAIATAERLPLPPTSAPEPDVTQVPRRPRSAKVLAIVSAVAVLLAIGVGVSRAQVAGRLTQSDAALRDTRGQLDTSTAQVAELETRVQELEVEQAQLHTQLDDAHTGERDARTSLDACQDAWRMAVQFAHDGTPPPAIATQFAAKLVTCFEGKVPPSLF
jgi:uncharacterized protein HemX